MLMIHVNLRPLKYISRLIILKPPTQCGCARTYLQTVSGVLSRIDEIILQSNSFINDIFELDEAKHKWFSLKTAWYFFYIYNKNKIILEFK